MGAEMEWQQRLCGSGEVGKQGQVGGGGGALYTARGIYLLQIRFRVGCAENTGGKPPRVKGKNGAQKGIRNADAKNDGHRCVNILKMAFRLLPVNYP
jgi:hypothetical protein